MVSSNPLFRGSWTLKRLRGTVINDIWFEVLFFGAVATMVYCVSEFAGRNISIDNHILDVVGVVLGLVISFRTSSAYERYSEGRTCWSSIHTACRTTAQLIWVNVPVHRKDMTDIQCVIEKKSMLNLVQAFPVALKHYLRNEPGIYYEDLYPLISWLPRYGSKNPSAHGPEDLLPLWAQSEEEAYALPHPTTQSTASLPASLASHKAHGFGYLPDVDLHRPLKPARNPPKGGLLSALPFLRFFRWVGRMFFRRAQAVAETVGVKNRNAFGRKRKLPPVDSNVPRQICLYLTSYLNYITENNLLQGPVVATVGDAIFALQGVTSQLERIKSTPLPFAYQAHLRMSLWLYLFFLPFEVFDSLGWMVIPGTVFASFLMLGFLEIGQEIEDPFGYDDNDLDVDGFVFAIQREIASVVVHDSRDPFVNVFSHWNQPFAPADRRTAQQLSEQDAYYHQSHQGKVDQGMDSIKRTLLNTWKEVNEKTRREKFYN